MEILGIDIGGSGIKGIRVDAANGKLLGERLRLPTPANAAPEAVGKVIREIAGHFKWKGPIGCGFPGVILGNVVHTSVNLDGAFVGLNLAGLIEETTGCPAWIINDADAAGLAEMRFGAGAGRRGAVIVLTVGTGIGSAIFTGGRLLANCEIGHLIWKGRDAETIISEPARRKKDLSWKQWAKLFNQYLIYLDKLFWPELFILGGGGVKKAAKITPHLKCRAEIAFARFKNRAGMLGAALAAAENLRLPEPKQPQGR